MVAGAYFADGIVPRRGDLPLAGSLICYRPYECADGWVSLGALEPKFWQAWCRGVGREDLVGAQFERPRLERPRATSQEIFRCAHARAVGGRSRANTTAAWSPCSSSTRRWTPSSCARARWSSRSSSPAAERPGPPARHAGEARRARPASTPACPGPALGEHTEEVLLEAGYRGRGRGAAALAAPPRARRESQQGATLRA